MKAKHQRLILATLALAAVVLAGLLAVSALQDKAAYFYAPSDIASQKPAPGARMRLGGMVADKSIIRAPDGITIRFVVEDKTDKVAVEFRGIAPDLFKEKSGVVAEGTLRPDGVFIADNLLAKHDERYMPPELEGKMHKTDSLSK